MLAIGETCPLFELKDQDGKIYSLKNQLGKKVLILFFYPKDHTPGCTKEACTFRDNYDKLLELGCEVIGISADSVESHEQFSSRNMLKYPILSDSDNSVRKSFKIPSHLLGLIPGRATFVIDKEGKVRGSFNSLTDTNGHVKYALEIVSKLSHGNN